MCRAGTASTACGRAGNLCTSCPFNTVCGSGTCNYPGPTPPSQGFGAACTLNTQCQSATGVLTGGSCIPPTVDGGATSGFPGGYCSPGCTSTCIAGGECINVGTFSRCFQSCPAPDQGQSSCRSGYVCVGLTDPQMNLLPFGICFPSCTQPGNGCQSPTFCNSFTGQCE